MEIGKTYNRNNHGVKFDFVIPNEKIEIKVSVYNSFDFSKCIKVHFNGFPYYQYKLSENFYFFPVFTENKTTTEIFKCELVKSIKINKFIKSKSKTPSYAGVLELNNKQFMTKNLIITDNQQANEMGIIKYLVTKLKALKSSDLHLFEF